MILRGNKKMRWLYFVGLVLGIAAPALAQYQYPAPPSLPSGASPPPNQSSQNPTPLVRELLSQGYELRIVYYLREAIVATMQKGSSAYACMSTQNDMSPAPARVANLIGSTPCSRIN